MTVFFAYLGLSILLTYPLVFHLDTSLFGDFGDSRGGVWWLWAYINGHFSESINPMMVAPFGIPSASAIRQPVTELLSLALAYCFGEIASYNLFILLAFPLTAVSTFFVLQRLLNHNSAAFWGGLVFGFSPVAVLQAVGGHPTFAFNVFIPLLLLALFNNRVRRNRVTMFWTAFCFLGVVFSSLYMGFFTLFFVLFFVVFDLGSTESRTEKLRAVHGYLVIAIFTALMALPVVYRDIMAQFTVSHESLGTAGRIRNVWDLIVYSSRIWEFFIPSIDHPIFGEILRDYRRARLHSSNFNEQTLFLGWVPVTLIFTGLYWVYKKKLKSYLRFNFFFSVSAMIFMWYMSLPPLLNLFNGKLPTLSYYAYQLAPMFRVYSRIGIFVSFFVAFASAVVIAHLSTTLDRKKFKISIATLTILLCFEYWSVPPGYALPVDSPPEVYRWLSTIKDDVVVAEYPMVPYDQQAHYSYMLWQRVHQKRMVNGAPPGHAQAWEFYQQIKDLDQPGVVNLLKDAGVKFVIFHQAMFAEGPIPNAIKHYFPPEAANVSYKVPSIPIGLRLLKAFGSDLVFEVENEKGNSGG